MTLVELIQKFNKYEIMPSCYKNQYTTIFIRVHKLLESRKKMNPNIVLTIMTKYRPACMIAARIWYPPKGKIIIWHVSPPTDSPLPFTGIYKNRYGTRIVNCNEKLSLLKSKFYGQIRKAQPPWCILTKSQKQSLLKQ